MWTSVAHSGLALAVLTFLMWVLRKILTPVVDAATSGPHASEPSVQQVSGYFAALTQDNLILLAALGVGIFFIGRAAAERNLAR